MTNRFFVDVTAIYFQGERGGIPRVVRKYVEQLSLHEDIRLVCFVHAGNNFYAVPEGSIVEPRRIASYLKWMRAVLRIRNYAAFPLYDFTLAIWVTFRAVLLFFLALASRVTRIDHFDRGDVIFLPYLPRSASFSTQIARCNRGAITVAMIYDLFPLQYPHQFLPELRAIFERGLAVQVGLADLIICSSRTTADRVNEYLRTNGLHKAVSFVYLGSDVEGLPLASGKNSVVSEGLPGVPTILGVGTLEPRKNYSYALALCDRLWGAGLDFRYVIVGGINTCWLEIARKIHEHPEHGRRLLHRRTADDVELLDLYRTSSYLLAVSIDEGFGLPVVEARRYGLPIICSDIAIFRELHHAASFISLDDPANAAACIEVLLRQPRSSVGTAQEDGTFDALITWRESAARLRRTIAEHQFGSCRSVATSTN